MSARTLRLDPMTGDDAVAVGALLRESFAERLHPYISYCQPDVTAYLLVLAEHPDAFPGRHLRVLRDRDGAPMAFAEFRAIAPDTDLLSYICVAPEARGRAVAEELMRGHLRTRSHLRAMVLDVFAHNVPARRLYERLGFEVTETTTWWSRALPANSADSSLSVLDWHVSLAALRAYGFCMVDIERAGSRIRLGLPSATVVRVPSEAAFADDVLLGALRHCIPTLERALWINSSAPTAEPNPERVLDSMRLRAPLPLAAA